MRMKLLTTAAAAAVFALAPAAQAVTFTQINFLPTGVSGLTSTYGASGLNSGAFMHTFDFTLPDMGDLTASLVTIALSLGTSGDVNFSGADIDGTAFTLSPSGFFETGALDIASIASGPHTLTVSGNAIGGGSYSGTVNFTPTGVIPEPATWALMMLGIGGVGAAMRRRGTQKTAMTVRYC